MTYLTRWLSFFVCLKDLMLVFVGMELTWMAGRVKDGDVCRSFTFGAFIVCVIKHVGDIIRLNAAVGR